MTEDPTLNLETHLCRGSDRPRGPRGDGCAVIVMWHPGGRVGKQGIYTHAGDVDVRDAEVTTLGLQVRKGMKGKKGEKGMKGSGKKVRESSRNESPLLSEQ